MPKLMALKFAAASGANVSVTSGSETKTPKALSLGAKGGVNYKEAGWEKKLVETHLKDQSLDAVVDGGEGDVVSKGVSILKVNRRSRIQMLTDLTRLRSAGKSSRYTQ